MQFSSTILALALTASGALAAPGTGLGRRAGSLTVEYYSAGNCESNTLLAIREYDDENNAGCQEPLVDVTGIQKFKVIQNSLTRESRFFSNQDCLFKNPNVGQKFEVAAGKTTECISFPVKSFDVQPYVETD